MKKLNKLKKFKWTEVQKKALRGSIRKWDLIANGKLQDHGTDDCPCCKIWNNKKTTEEAQCIGCPISAFVGEINCKNTPYLAYCIVTSYRLASKTDAAYGMKNFLVAVYMAGGGK